MKITFVAPHAGYSGGIRVIARHAEGLRRKGHEVLVVSQPMPRFSLKKRIRHAIMRRASPDWMSQRGGHLDGVPIEHRVLPRARPVINRDVPDADVVIATWWETAEWIHALSPSKGAKVYFIQGDEADFGVDEAMCRRVIETWRLPLTKITISSWLENLGKSRCPGHPFHLVHNAVDTNVFNAEPRGKQNVPTVGMIFSTFRNKGADIILDAYALAKRSAPTLRLVAFGDSPADGGPPWPSELPLEVRPPQPRIPQLYASCDAWLFGTRREGFGLPLLEAMACRTPVIGTPAGAAPELLQPGGGILVKPEDPADMAAAIARVVEMSDDRWRIMSDVSHRTALGFTWERATDRFESALVEAVRRGTTAGPASGGSGGGGAA